MLEVRGWKLDWRWRRSIPFPLRDSRFDIGYSDFKKILGEDIPTFIKVIQVRC